MAILAKSYFMSRYSDFKKSYNEKTPVEKFRWKLSVISIVAAIMATSFAFSPENMNYSPRIGVIGGAAGFATLSGLALVAIAITYLKKEE